MSCSSSSSCWEEIPSDLLGLILSGLSFTDQIRSSCVCTSWALAAAEHPAKSKTPWLMLPGAGGSDHQDYRHLYSLHNDERIYPIHLPRIRGWRFLGSCDGWLVAIGEKPQLQLHVLNPLTGFQAPLPPINTFSSIHRAKRDATTGQITGYMVKEGNFNRNPTYSNMNTMWNYFIIKAIYFPSASVAIAIHSAFRELAFARIGDDSWTEIRLKDEYDVSRRCLFDDIILHKGIFYVLNSRACVYGFDLANNNTTLVTFEGPHDIEEEVPDTGGIPHYLVESQGDLLLICREVATLRPWSYYRYNRRRFEPFRFVCRTKWFKVYKIDPIRFKWVELKSLGEMTIFVGCNHSVSIRSRGPELKPNCIYFTESTSTTMAVPHKRRDMGVFNLQDGTIEPFFPKDDHLLHTLNWPPPIWITPSLS